MKFEKYKRTQVAEMYPVTDFEIRQFKQFGKLPVFTGMDRITGILDVSISKEDLRNGSPKIGDMIARNPDNHNDQWLVAKDYFEKNFEPLT